MEYAGKICSDKSTDKTSEVQKQHFRGFVILFLSAKIVQTDGDSVRGMIK